MNERTAKLIAKKIEAMDTANAEHDVAVALKLDTERARLEALALVKSPSAPATYVRRYTDLMLLALTGE
jgi:hypothetical protein